MIGIIGGGITGLSLAHALAARNIPFTVFERRASAGGVIRTVEVDGHLLELGPQRTRLTRAVNTLIDDLGLAGSVIHAPADLPLLVYHTGRLRAVPFSARALLRGDLLGVRGRMRVLLEPLTAGAAPDETVAHYFTRKLGRAAYENLAGPLYGGLYASDPADMLVGISLDRTLRDIGVRRSLVVRALRAGGRVSAPPAISFAGGMQTLTDALHQRHQPFIRTGVAVTGISRHADGYDVQTDHGSTTVSDVVMTTPARETAALLATIAPDAAAAIAPLHYNPLAVVHLHTKAQVRRALGYQVGFGETMITRGVTFNSALFGRQGICTAYLGGAHHPEVADWSDERVAAQAVTEFRIVTGLNAEALLVSRAAMPAWDRTWQAFAEMRGSSTAGVHLCANWESRPGIPGRLLEAERLAEMFAARAR